jgi:mannosyltransferase OCH1-like enzyme
MNKSTNVWCNDVQLMEICQIKHQLWKESLENIILDDSLKIPKLIHFIWLGSSLPLKYSNIINVWKEKHPNFDIKIWNDEDVELLQLENINIFNNGSNYGIKSDILRYEILYNLGGIYIDIDYECIQSLENLTNTCSFFSGISNTSVCLKYQ